MYWAKLIHDPYTAQFLLIFFPLVAIIVYHYIFSNPRRPPVPPRIDPLPAVPAPRAVASSSGTEARVPQSLVSRPTTEAPSSIFAEYPTISVCCGTLFRETEEQALGDGIDFPPDVLKVLKEAISTSKVYLLLLDKSDGGIMSAILTSALEAEGILGTSSGQIPKHRVLTCTTETGKIAIIRQLECSLHLESESRVHTELGRFHTKQWFIPQPQHLIQLMKDDK